jgi:carboxylesterase
VNTTGILLVHGFAGGINEVALLRDHLTERGYQVECPLLLGHGGTKKELAKTTYKDWIASADHACNELSKRCDRIVAVGFSMGGLIAVNLRHHGFAGIVTVNTPYYYWNHRIIAANLKSDFRHYGRKYLAASTDKPLSSMIEFQKLLTRTKPMFGDITCKALVVQALDDDTVHKKSAEHIYNKLRGEKTYFELPSGGHIIFQSNSGLQVCEMIERFLQSI